MIVLDTHVWHWWVNQISGKLSPEMIALIEETDEVGVSAISCFEMAWLIRHGRIDPGMPYDEWFALVSRGDMVSYLPVTPSVAAKAVALPEHHKDPHDRIIMATALEFGASLLSYDTAFNAYRELDGFLLPG